MSDQGRARFPGDVAHRNKRRAKQEEADAALNVKVDDLGQNAEGWVIYNHGALFVLLGLIVAARIKRADEIARLLLVLCRNVLSHNLVNVVRRVAIVRCLLCFKLVKEGVIVFISFLIFTVPLLAVFKPVAGARAIALTLKTKKAHVDLFDRVHVDLQRIPVEAAIHRQLVVGKRVRFALFVAQPVEADALHFSVAEFLQGHPAAMAFDDDVIIAPDADGVQIAERFDARLDLFDLPGRVFLRVVRIRLQRVDAQRDDFHLFTPPSVSCALFKAGNGKAFRFRSVELSSQKKYFEFPGEGKDLVAQG